MAKLLIKNKNWKIMYIGKKIISFKNKENCRSKNCIGNVLKKVKEI